MNLYAVFAEGVYRHACLGIFSTLDAAKTTAQNAAITDKDDYHTYDVTCFQLDVQTAWDEYSLERLPTIYSVKKSGNTYKEIIS